MLVVDWSKFVDGIFLLWRCCLCGRGWSLVGVVRVVEAGMYQQAASW